METRIPGSLDMPRLGGQPRALDSDNVSPRGSASSSSIVAPLSQTSTSGAAEKSQANPKDRPDLQAAVVEMNDFVQSVNRDIDFRLDDDSGRVVVSITDRETGNVIRQIPSEDALKLAESLSEARSLLLKTEV